MKTLQSASIRPTPDGSGSATRISTTSAACISCPSRTPACVRWQRLPECTRSRGRIKPPSSRCWSWWPRPH